MAKVAQGLRDIFLHGAELGKGWTIRIRGAVKMHDKIAVSHLTLGKKQLTIWPLENLSSMDKKFTILSTTYFP